MIMLGYEDTLCHQAPETVQTGGQINTKILELQSITSKVKKKKSTEKLEEQGRLQPESPEAMSPNLRQEQ